MSTHVNTLHAIACLTACEVSHSIHCYSVQRFNRIKLILRSKCLALAGSCEEMAGSFEQADCRRLPKIAGGCQCSIPAIRLDQYTGPGTTCTMYSTFWFSKWCNWERPCTFRDKSIYFIMREARRIAWVWVHRQMTAAWQIAAMFQVQILDGTVDAMLQDPRKQTGDHICAPRSRIVP